MLDTIIDPVGYCGIRRIDGSASHQQNESVKAGKGPMFLLMRVVAIWLVALGGATKSSLAQSNSLSPHEFVSNLLQQMRIDDITEDAARAIVRASRLHPDRQSVPGVLIICDRTQPGHEFLVATDYADRLTDDRLVVGSGFCDATLALIRQHQDAQQR